MYELSDIDYYSCWFENYIPNDSLIKIIKYHPYNEELHEWADNIIVCKRSFLSAMASLKKYKRIKTYEKFMGMCGIMASWHYDWIDYADYVFDYDMFMENKELATNELLRLLDLEIGSTIVLDGINEFMVNVGTGIKSETLLFTNHITDSKISDLTYEEALFITENCPDLI